MIFLTSFFRRGYPLFSIVALWVVEVRYPKISIFRNLDNCFAISPLNRPYRSSQSRAPRLRIALRPLERVS